MEKLFQLKKKEVIEAITGTTSVYYRHGVWNNYSLTDTVQVVKDIQRDGWADLWIDDGKYYVSIPADSDMF